MRQFRTEHHSVFLFIVQLQTLEEVFVAPLFLVLFALAEDRQEFVQLHFLFALLLRATQLFDGRICGVQVQRAKDVAKINRIDDVGAVIVVNREGEFCPFLTKGIISYAFFQLYHTNDIYHQTFLITESLRD